MIVIFSGLPGTGKSTLAEHAARRLRAPHFGIDVIEAALWRSGVRAQQGSHAAAYELLGASRSVSCDWVSQRASTRSPVGPQLEMHGRLWQIGSARRFGLSNVSARIGRFIASASKVASGTSPAGMSSPGQTSNDRWPASNRGAASGSFWTRCSRSIEIWPSWIRIYSTGLQKCPDQFPAPCRFRDSPFDSQITTRRKDWIMNKVLWTLQVLLGVFYALASGMPKLVFLDQLPPAPIPLPVSFVQFIGVCEVLGGLGLILPGITHIKPSLTPLAALGLAIITIGATGYNLLAGMPESAVFAAVMVLLVTFVGYGRWQLIPHRARAKLTRAYAY